MLLKSLNWATVHWYLICPILVYIATSIGNALLKNPETETLGHAILDRVSMFSRKDSPGKMKLPGKRSKKTETKS
jgi:hypothetical protein